MFSDLVFMNVYIPLLLCAVRDRDSGFQGFALLNTLNTNTHK